jgi:uncharacterized protein YukE
MSFVTVGPEAMLAKAADLAGIASTISTANSIAAAQTTSVPAPAADGVSAVVAEVFDSHAQNYQEFGAQMAAIHEQLVQTLTANGNAYANAEAANAQRIGSGARSLLGGF